MGPLCGLHNMVASSLNKKPPSVIHKEESLQICSPSQYLLIKLSNDFNGYLEHLEDTFMNWRNTLDREDISATCGETEYTSAFTKTFLPLSHNERSSDDSEYSSKLGKVDYAMSIGTSQSSITQTNHMFPKHNYTFSVVDSDFDFETHVANSEIEIASAEPIGYNHDHTHSLTIHGDRNHNFSIGQSVTTSNDLVKLTPAFTDKDFTPIRKVPLITHGECNNASTFTHQSTYVDLNCISSGNRSPTTYLGIDPILNPSQAPNDVPNISYQRLYTQNCECFGLYNTVIPGDKLKLNSDTPGQDSKLLSQLHTMLEQEEKKSMARLLLLEAEKEDREAWRLALKYKHKISRLNAEDLMKETDEGFSYLLNWIEQVEMNSFGDSMRIYMLKFTADKSLLRLLKLKQEPTKSVNATTWGEVKKRLMSLIPKCDIRKATFKLLTGSMQETDNIKIFAAKVTTRYEEVCELYEVTTLPISLYHVIAHKVTANMNQTGRELYYDDIREDSENIITEMEKSLWDISFRQSLFKQANFRSEPGDQTIPTACTTGGPSLHSYQHRQGDVQRGYKEVRKNRLYKRKKCCFFQRGSCKFGNDCRYEHI